jgi:hypothetical protein
MMRSVLGRCIQVLNVDPNIECYSSTHNGLMAVAVVGFVLYTFGYARPNFESAGHGTRSRAASWLWRSWRSQ